ncbi:MAG: uracil-DNA glycosylase [Alphaproteobacteria bacterium]|nr:uracil-DNA glycosylase [Alphaproteobacteria bacterium]
MATADHKAALDALIWLVESGADEAVLDAPENRLSPGRHLRDQGPAREPGYFRDRASIPEIPGEATRPSPMPSPPSDRIEEAAEIAARCQTLEELRAALEAYEGSVLKAGALKTVFADGNPLSRTVFVGEAPGFEEDRIGLPFVGRAGKLLDQMLAAIHLDRQKTYIVNVLPWRPPDNRNPEAIEVAKCLPFLKRHLELVGPKLLVLLGASAVRHLLGIQDGIMRTRGRWLEYRVGATLVPVMPTLHPAYLLRAPAHKRLAWRDLQAIAARLTELEDSPLATR